MRINADRLASVYSPSIAENKGNPKKFTPVDLKNSKLPETAQYDISSTPLKVFKLPEKNYYREWSKSRHHGVSDLLRPINNRLLSPLRVTPVDFHSSMQAVTKLLQVAKRRRGAINETHRVLKV
jgi:hypothetical protein